MKKNITFTAAIFMSVFVSMFLLSCRKIDTGKLTGDWKVVSLTSVYTYNDQKYETIFDGTTKTNNHYVNNVIDLTDTYTGAIWTDYHNDGSYVYSETFRNNISGITETIGIDGNWYFTDANSDAGWAVTDLLAMQSDKNTYNTDLGTLHTTLYQGNNTLDIYEISTLSKSKIVLKMNKAEKINFVQYITNMEFTLEPR